MKFLLTIGLVGLFAYLLGGAIDYEMASGGALSERAEGSEGSADPGTPGVRQPFRAVPSSSRSESVPTYQGKPILWWAKRAVQARRDANARGRTIRRLKRELANRHEPSSVSAIALASVAYRVSFSTLYRKAACETGGTFSPYAKNPKSTASGLFQFLTSTWATTPYARFSIWDPYANALAAGWMHRAGRGGEWVCR